MKKLILLVIVLLIGGLILVPKLTKTIVSITGKATVDTTSQVASVIKKSPEVKEAYQRFKQEVNDSVKKLDTP